MRAPNCATGPSDNHHRSGNEEGRSIEESWRRMGAMWLGPLLFVAVSIFLWKYVGAVFLPELIPSAGFQLDTGQPGHDLEYGSRAQFRPENRAHVFPEKNCHSQEEQRPAPPSAHCTPL